MTRSFDVAIVGAGIVGLANAYIAAKQGKKVLVCERDPQAVSASVRNFGMIWPVGQPAGEMREIAIRSRRLWLELLNEAGLWYRECGSLHLAYQNDELAVLEEFCEKGPRHGYKVSLLTPSETFVKSPVIERRGLLGAIWSDQELCVDPREVVSHLPKFLYERFGVEFLFSTVALHAETGKLITTRGQFAATQIFLCGGSDFETLFPKIYSEENIVRCKLQMLRAKPKSSEYRTGPHLCAGLTLAHYGNFQLCDSLTAYVERVAKETPEYMQWHIHVLVSQHANGDLTLGDSHEYGNVVSPFNRDEIDELILRYLNGFLPIAEFDVVERWQGVYAKCMNKPFVVREVEKGVSAIVGVGGAGMTLSFGLAEHVQNFF